MMADDFWANTPQEPRQPEVEIREVSAPASCAASRQQFIVTTTANVKAKNVEEALLDLFAGDEYEVRAASPPPEPQEWACDLCDGKGKYYPRAEVPASYEAPWCPICHGSGTVPPEPQGTDEERSE
jgi:hypothetical protein